MSNFYQNNNSAQKINDIPESLSAIKTLSKSFMVP